MNRAAFIVAFGTACLLCLAALPGPEAYEPRCGVSLDRLAKQGDRWALIVSVNNYLDDSDSALFGPGNDMEELCRLLTGRFGLPARHVLRLHGPDANRAAILDGFEALRKRGGEGRQLIFAYAGHGAFIADQDPDEEPDGQDETLCPWDHAVAGDLRDDHLEDLYSAWLQTGAEVTVLLDSCHSGSSMRGDGDEEQEPGMRARLTGPSPAGAPYDGSFRDRLEARSQDATDRFVSLAAASDDELAQERLRHDVGRYHGVFSFALLDALRTLPRGSTWQDVASRVRGDLLAHTYNSKQHPVFIGNLSRGLFRDVEEGEATFRVRKVTAGAEPSISVDAGSMAGLDVGARLAVGEAIYEVTSVDATSSVAQRRGDPPPKHARVRPGAEARLLSLGASDAPEPVHLHPALTAPVASALRTTIELNPLLELGAGGEQPPAGELAVRPHSKLDGCVAIDGGPAAWPGAGARSTPDGCRLQSGGLVTPDVVAITLAQFAGWRRFLALHNDSASRLDVRAALTVEILRDPGTGWVAAAPDAADPSSLALLDEDRFGLAYTNRTEERLYVTVVYLSGDGSIEVLNERELAQALEPGRRVDLGVLLRIGPPFGVDFVKVFVGDEATGSFAPRPFLSGATLRDGEANAAWAVERFGGEVPPAANVRGWGTLEIPLRVRP